MITDEQLAEWEKGGYVVLHASDGPAFTEMHERCARLISEVRSLREENKQWEQDWHDVGKHTAARLNKLHDLLKSADGFLFLYELILKEHKKERGLKELRQFRSEIAEVLP